MYPHVGPLTQDDKAMCGTEPASIFVWLTIFIAMQTTYVYMHFASTSLLKRFPEAIYRSNVWLPENKK
jgi:hypothetical protein